MRHDGQEGWQPSTSLWNETELTVDAVTGDFYGTGAGACGRVRYSVPGDECKVEHQRGGGIFRIGTVGLNKTSPSFHLSLLSDLDADG